MKTKLLLIAGLFLILGCTQNNQKETINLTYSIFFPATHIQAKTAVKFCEQIELATNGKIKITPYPGGTLTKAPQVYDGVVKGISDIGMSCFAYTRGRFPITAALDLPLGYPDGITASKVADKFIKTVNPDELKDVKILYIHAHGPGILHSKTKVEKLEDLKDLKIRATGLSAEIVKDLGATPVAMAQGETYEALQKSLVTGTFGPMEVLKGWKQADVIDYTTDCNKIGYTTSMFVVMNKEKWNSLSKDIQKVFEEISEEWVIKHGKAWDESDDAGREYTLSLNNEIIELSDSESEKWVNAVQPVIKNYIENTENGQEYVDLIKELMETVNE